MAKITLGTWAWGTGAFGGDTVFGSHTNVENLMPVFDAAMNKEHDLAPYKDMILYNSSSAS